MFNLSITLGNEAMQTADDLSRALAKVAARLRGREWDNFEGTIMDDNGNKVGTWSMEGATVPDDDSGDNETVEYAEED